MTGTAEQSFDSRLSRLEGHAVATEKRLDNVDSALGRIEAALNKAQGKPTFEPTKILSFVRDAGVLLGMAAAVIIYISTNLSSTPIAVMKTEMAQLSQRLGDAEERLRWRPEIANSRK